MFNSRTILFRKHWDKDWGGGLLFGDIQVVMNVIVAFFCIQLDMIMTMDMVFKCSLCNILCVIVVKGRTCIICTDNILLIHLIIFD